MGLPDLPVLLLEESSHLCKIHGIDQYLIVPKAAGS